ncbi:MAG: hypothetical protein M1338_03145 [Patescibacteria group bacterium]|nr:hypothetical protein [Patescibacteria group bacterium]
MLKTNQPYFKIIILIVIAIIFMVIGIYYSNKSKQNKDNYIPDNTEVEVIGSQGEAPQVSTPSVTGNANSSMGPAKVDDLIGGTNASEFYQAPSTEKLLEGKDIEINK